MKRALFDNNKPIRRKYTKSESRLEREEAEYRAKFEKAKAERRAKRLEVAKMVDRITSKPKRW